MQIGDIISYSDMTEAEGVSSLQKGMNYHVGDGDYPVFLMNVGPEAPYEDKWAGENTIIYEGHNIRGKQKFSYFPNNQVDQPMFNPSGSLTNNGKFYEAAKQYQNGEAEPVCIKVYEKLEEGVWVYNGFFNLVKAWTESSGRRKVFKFKLVLADDELGMNGCGNNYYIPASVKAQVWARYKGKCAICKKNTENLHYECIKPPSKGGSLRDPDNIRIVCRNCYSREHDEADFDNAVSQIASSSLTMSNSYRDTDSSFWKIIIFLGIIALLGYGFYKIYPFIVQACQFVGENPLSTITTVVCVIIGAIWYSNIDYDKSFLGGIIIFSCIAVLLGYGLHKIYPFLLQVWKFILEDPLSAISDALCIIIGVIAFVYILGLTFQLICWLLELIWNVLCYMFMLFLQVLKYSFYAALIVVSIYYIFNQLWPQTGKNIAALKSKILQNKTLETEGKTEQQTENSAVTTESKVLQDKTLETEEKAEQQTEKSADVQATMISEDKAEISVQSIENPQQQESVQVDVNVKDGQGNIIVNKYIIEDLQ